MVERAQGNRCCPGRQSGAVVDPVDDARRVALAARAARSSAETCACAAYLRLAPADLVVADFDSAALACATDRTRSLRADATISKRLQIIALRKRSSIETKAASIAPASTKSS